MYLNDWRRWDNSYRIEDELKSSGWIFGEAAQGDLRFILKHLTGNDVDQPISRLRMTRMHFSAFGGKTLMIQVLVDIGSTAICSRDKEGNTPMHCAAYQDDPEIIETLVRLGAESTIDAANNYGVTPMHIAAVKGGSRVIEVLVRLGSKAIDAQITESKKTPLFLAAEDGKFDVIETLVRLGSRAVDTPDAYGRVPMHRAVERGCVTTVETLARLGCTTIDVSKGQYLWYSDLQPIDIAVMKGNVPMIQAIGRSGHTNHSSRALEFACWREDLVECLVQLGYDVDQVDSSGRTAMHSAAWFGQVKGIAALVRFGSQAMDLADKDSRTPFNDLMLTHKADDPVATYILMRQLGATSEVEESYHFGYDEEDGGEGQRIDDAMKEEAVLETRFRVFFARSLVQRLLFELGKPLKLK